MNPWQEQLLRARAAMELKRWEVAWREIAGALAQAPDNVVLHATKAEIGYRLENFSEAREAASEVVRLEPEWNAGYIWLAWIVMGDAEAGEQRPAQAVALAERALECDANDSFGYYVRAAAASFAWDASGACRYASQGLAIDPQHEGCLKSLAAAQIERQRDADAAVTLRRMLELKPESVFAHAELARIALRGQRYHDAYAHVSTVIATNPESASLRELYSEVVSHLHPVARFFLRIERALETYPSLGFVGGLMALVPVFSLTLLPKDTSTAVGASLTALGFFFAMAVLCSGALAIFAADTVIAWSGKFSRLVPETRSRRFVYAAGWLAAAGVILGTLSAAFLMSAQPILLVVNTLLAGGVIAISRLAADENCRRATCALVLVPIVMQGVALFWTPDDALRSVAFSLTIAGWGGTFIAAVLLSGIR